jgi:hypothetical protein
VGLDNKKRLTPTQKKIKRLKERIEQEEDKHSSRTKKRQHCYNNRGFRP